jgi:hypothetical protein
MTLLVAGISENVLWMVADTFVTGGPLETRAYEHQIKVVPSQDGGALIGFRVINTMERWPLRPLARYRAASPNIFTELRANIPSSSHTGIERMGSYA